MRNQLTNAFDAVVASHSDAEASHLTAVEEDEAYSFVRDIGCSVKEVYRLIDSYFHPCWKTNKGCRNP